MYEGWHITSWDTPVRNMNRLMMVSLTDASSELTLVFEDTTSTERRRWRVRCQHYPAYRNINESYRLVLWCWLDQSGQRCGATFIMKESSPFESWKTEYLHDVAPTTRHFVIATNDDVVEVLSIDDPVWEQVAGAEPDEPYPGKSEHFFVGEDEEAIQQLVDDLQSKNKVY